MSLDYSAVPRMPDGRTAAEHIAAIEATASRKVLVPMGNGGKMMWHIWSENSGKPILLLFHGGSGSWIHWIRNVQPLSQHFTIYAADAPGLGDSDPPNDVRDVWSVTHCVEHAMKELLPSDKLSAHEDNHFGLGFLRRKVKEAGGHLQVQSRPGVGTRVTAQLPLHEVAS